MVDPNTATNLVAQMKAVSQQFLGFVPVGSSYYYNNNVWIVTGQIDSATGQLVLHAANGTGTTLLNSIQALYPSAVTAASTTAGTAAAAGGGGGLSSLLSLAPTAMSAPSLINSIKGKTGVAGLPGASGTQTIQQAIDGHQVGEGLSGSGSGSQLPSNLVPTQANLNTITSNISTLQNQINTAQDTLNSINPQIESLEKSLNSWGYSTGPVSSQNIGTFVANSLPGSDAYNQATALQNLYTQHAQATTLINNAVPVFNQLQLQQTSMQNDLAMFKSTSTDFQGNASDSFNSLDPTTKAAVEYQYQSAYTKAGGTGEQGPADTLNDYTENQLRQNLSTLSPEDQQTILSNAQADVAKNPGLSLDDAMNNEAQKLYDQKFTDLAKNASQQYQHAEKVAAGEFGAELAAAAGTAYGEESAISSMFANGFSGKEFATAIGTGFGLYISLHLMNSALTGANSPLLQFLYDHIPNILGKDVSGFLGSALKSLTSGWGFLAIEGAIVLLGWLLGKSKPSAEEQAAETLNAEVAPVVWNPSGQVIFLTAGLTMASLGINLGPTAPMMQTMVMSQAQVSQALTNLGASGVPTDSTRYADVFVQQGAAGQPTRVVYLTPDGTDSKGNVIETVHEQTLNPNYQFASQQPPTGYVPFFVPGPNGKVTPNAQVVNSLTAQQHLLQCADGTWVTTAQQCANAAGTTSHSSGN